MIENETAFTESALVFDLHLQKIPLNNLKTEYFHGLIALSG